MTASYGEPEKFVAAVLKSKTDACVDWPFGRASNGYGSVSYDGVIGSAHRLVCRLFYGEPPTPIHQAAHSCGRGKQGCVNPRHLRWATPRENSDDVDAHGHRVRGSKASWASLTEEDVVKIRAAADGGAKTSELSREYNVAPSNISMIKHRKSWVWL